MTDQVGSTASRLEALQDNYDGEDGFLGVVFDGDDFWIVGDASATAGLAASAQRDGARLANSCVEPSLFDAAAEAMATLEYRDGEFSSVAYNVLTDSVDVISTMETAWVRARIAALTTAEQPSTEATLRVSRAEGGNFGLLAGRLADTAPFFGGAKIQTDLGNCSTGFYLNSAVQGTVMLTAGHCGPNGDVVENGASTWEVGTIEGRTFPSPDLAVLDGKNYAPFSFSANNNTTAKPINGGANPGTGALYCQMGYVSQRICASYSSLNAQYCIPQGCNGGMAFTSRACTSPLGQPGDSGGGVFWEGVAGVLGARAMVVAGGQISPTQCARYDHRMATILAQYDAVVVAN